MDNGLLLVFGNVVTDNVVAEIGLLLAKEKLIRALLSTVRSCFLFRLLDSRRGVADIKAYHNISAEERLS